MWLGFAELLAEATGCGALVYSRAGYGSSDPAPLPRPVRFMHDEALQVLPEVLDRLGIADAIPVGHSDGASIALIHAAASAGRGRIRALVLEAPHVFVEPLTLASIAALRERYGRSDLRSKLERRHGANTDDLFRSWTDVWLHPGFLAWNLEDYLPAVQVPILVIQGENDEFGTVRQVEAIAAKAGGTVETVLLPECRHSPHRDRKEETLAAMARFIRSGRHG